MKRIILSLIFWVVCAFSFGANIFYVTTTGNDSNDGKSWATAFKDVQKAIDTAYSVATDTNPSQVWIAKGTYYNAGGTYNSSTKVKTTFVMKNNVAIYGGFAGTESSLDERVSGNETILTTEGSYVIYNYTSSITNTTAKLDSVTIKGSGHSGIRNDFSEPSITNCTITANGRFGIYNYFSEPSITNCTITANGDVGIYNYTYCYPTITNCTITANGGDGIYNYNSCFPTITNCTITANGRHGFYNHCSSPIITNCIIWGNAFSGILDSGSGNEYEYPTIICCIRDGDPDPKLGTLGYYGGVVQTIPVLENSPAIGAGITGENIPTTDARGVARNIPCTIGAYEYTESVIISEPVTAFLKEEGEDASFSVESTGYNLSYQWYKNGVAISGATNATLSLKNVKLSDDKSTYYCVVSNGGATIKSNEVKLFFTKISIVSEPPSSLEVCEKTKYNLILDVVDKDNNKLTYAWYVDKQDGKKHSKVGNKSTLTITPTLKMLGWQYYCKISNKLEELETGRYTIDTIREATKITGKPKALTAFEGKANAGFSVVATGYQVKYQWQWYDAKAKQWINIEGATSSTYYPDSADENDGLTYRCKVYNDGSVAYTNGVKFTVRDEADIEAITLYQKPEKAKDAHEVEIEEEAEEYNDITLTAIADGYKIKYQWYLDGNPIKGATKKTLTIKNPQIGSYEYSCRVYNESSKGVTATEDEESFLLVVEPLDVPVDLNGKVLIFEDEYGYVFTFAGTSKSACVLINEEEYNEPELSSMVDIFTPSSYSYKVKAGKPTELKLTFTRVSYLGAEKQSSKKEVLQGTLSLFDEEGDARFECKDGKIYNLKRILGAQALPDDLIGKTLLGGIRIVDKKVCYLNDLKGSYTYKKLSNNVSKFTFNFKGYKATDGYLISVGDEIIFRYKVSSEFIQGSDDFEEVIKSSN